jgi:hypothetical protein
MSEEARSDRDRILDMARAASAFPEPQRRRAIMGLMRERYRSVLSAADSLAGDLPCTEVEVFNAGYGDATGRGYWDAWLFPGKATANELAWLIAVHASCSAEEFERVKKQLTAGLAMIADKPARAMVEHLIADPDTGRFVPASLRACLGIAPMGQSTPSAGRRGQRPVQRERVQAAMRASLDAGGDIFGMKEEAMAATFEASRDTCREARKALARERP